MGPTHAMSGVAAWLTLAPAVAGTFGHTLTGAQLAVGAAVCSGSALLPDIDNPNSTIARSFGLPSVMVAHAVNGASALVYNATRTRKEEARVDGHRLLTHAVVVAVGTGALVTSLVATVGRWAVLTVLFVTFGLAIRGLMADWARKQGWVGVTAASAAAAYATWQFLPPGNYWWLGFAVTFGMILHGMGDGITEEGWAAAWPIVWRGKRWWEFALPSGLRLTTGKGVEMLLLLPLLTAISVLAGLHAYDPNITRALLGQ